MQVNRNDKDILKEFLDKWRKREDHIAKEIVKLVGYEEETKLKIAKGKETDLVKKQIRDHAHWTQELQTRERQKWRICREAVKDLEVFEW